MREKMEQLKAGWTSPNVFPWDELTEVICELDERLAAVETSNARRAAKSADKAVPGKAGQAMKG